MKSRSRRRRAASDDTRKSAALVPARAPRLQLWITAAVLVAMTVAVFWPVVGFGFAGIDDPDYVTQNARVTAGLTASGAAWAFTTTHAANWHPLTWLSHMVDVEVFGVDAGAMHAVNLAFHAANAVLLLAVLHSVTGSVVRSSIAAALFAVHPLHVESVAWIAERKDVLSTLFLFSTLYAYVRAVRTASRGWLGGALALYALGLMAKPMLVTLPALLVLIDWWRTREPIATRVGELESRRHVFFVLLAAASSAVTVVAQMHGGAVRDLTHSPLAKRIANAVVTTVDYLVRMIWPVDLSPYYPYPAQFSTGRVAVCAFFIMAMTWAAVRFGRTAPHLRVGWTWYLVTLAPVIGVIQVGNQASADRYTYVPLIGIFIAIVWGVAALARSPRARAVGVAAGVAASLACATVARAQVAHWRDDVTIWRRAVEATAHLDNHSAHYALGVALRQRGDVDGAIANLGRAVALQPSFAAARWELGIALLARNRPADALPHLEAVLALDPQHPRAPQAVGEALVRLGRPADALPHFLALVARVPDRAEYRYQLGIVLLALNRRDDALARFDEALRLDPSHVGARRARASLGR